MTCCSSNAVAPDWNLKELESLAKHLVSLMGGDDESDDTPLTGADAVNQLHQLNIL